MPSPWVKHQKKIDHLSLTGEPAGGCNVVSEYNLCCKPQFRNTFKDEPIYGNFMEFSCRMISQVSNSFNRMQTSQVSRRLFEGAALAESWTKDGAVQRCYDAVARIFCWDTVWMITLQGTNISHLGKRKSIFKYAKNQGDMLIPWRVFTYHSRDLVTEGL